MRISDWSSDVCSSDLGSNSRCHVSRGQAVTLKLVRTEPDAHGILRAEHDRIADTVDATERILKLRGNNVAKIVGIAAAIFGIYGQHREKVDRRLGDAHYLLLHLRREQRRSQLELVFHLHLGDVGLGSLSEGGRERSG